MDVQAKLEAKKAELETALRRVDELEAILRAISAAATTALAAGGLDRSDERESYSARERRVS